MTITRFMHFACRLALMVLCFAAVAMAQTETATISGLITDDTGGVVPGAEVKLQSVERGSANSATTNNAGIYVFASVHPGQYQLTVHKPGFKQVDFLGLIVNVQDHIEQNFRLQVGSVAESVTVEASLRREYHGRDGKHGRRPAICREPATEWQKLSDPIQLTPGVVLTAITAYDAGQFSVNGQRATANYWMVDGVSANIGMSANNSAGNGLAGSLGSFSVLGGTNSLSRWMLCRNFASKLPLTHQNLAVPPEDRFPLLRVPGRINSTAPHSTICEMTCSTPITVR